MIGAEEIEKKNGRPFSRKTNVVLPLGKELERLSLGKINSFQNFPYRRYMKHVTQEGCGAVPG